MSFMTHQVVSTNSVVKIELQNLSKKFTNFSGVFDFMDLSALGFTLASALAKYSISGTLSCDEIRAGAPLLVRAVHTRADPVSAASNAVFIPRTTAVDASMGAFAALLAAANAWGATVFTDVLEVDGNNAPVVLEPTNNELAMGCVYGIRMLLSQYEAAGVGPVMAYAVTKGVHNVVSVAAHSDEGGYMRDVIRTRSFAPPAGGIFVEGMHTFVGLPMPQLESQASFRSLVDSIALGSAALVAVAAPLTEVDGRLYPSVYTSRVTAQAAPGDNTAATAADVVDLSQQIASDSGMFAAAYVQALGTLFSVEGDGLQAVNMLVTSFGSRAAVISRNVPAGKAKTARDANRHLSSVTVAPYFWIEPTSLIRGGFDEYPAFKAGYAHIANIGDRVEYPMFESVAAIEERGTFSNVGFKWRTARTTPLVWHLQGHPRDGLAAIKPRQFVKDKVHLSGGTDNVENLRNAGTDLAGYLWGRGQSPIPHPAEMMYLGELMGAVVVNCAIDPITFDITPSHFPTKMEMQDGKIAVEVRPPSEMQAGAVSEWDRKIRRSRDHAATALTNARAVISKGYTTGGSEFIIGDFEPSYRDVSSEAVIEVGEFTIRAQPGLNNAVLEIGRAHV